MLYTFGFTGGGHMGTHCTAAYSGKTAVLVGIVGFPEYLMLTLRRNGRRVPPFVVSSSFKVDVIDCDPHALGGADGAFDQAVACRSRFES